MELRLDGAEEMVDSRGEVEVMGFTERRRLRLEVMRKLMRVSDMKR